MTQDLLKTIEEKFESAKKGSQLFSFDSTVVTKESGSVKFELTYVPALGKKSSSSNKKEKMDPFENPDPALVVKELDEHIILLNKYSVIPKHILLVTKEFKEQTDLLLPNDLYEAIECIKAFGHSYSPLTFYNCGPSSGASQRHKHLQVIPLRRDSTVQPPIKQLYNEIHDRHVGQIYAINKLPFVHVIMELDKNIMRSALERDHLTEYLSAMFFGLLDAMFQQLRENTEIVTDSYNFLMTDDFMMLVPRTKESAVVEKEGRQHEFSLNSLAFAGLLLCKTEEELETLRSHDDLIDLLTQVTVPWNKNAVRLDAEKAAALTAELA
ncbi:ATP adenylyltransferase-domain-containing protein [Pilobolus umbonatus]|nr:ATP adenylyltransferase-domain-containing protein [Pilobolus umbonatus]